LRAGGFAATRTYPQVGRSPVPARGPGGSCREQRRHPVRGVVGPVRNPVGAWSKPGRAGSGRCRVRAPWRRTG
jgi:hypothetical protein